MEECGVSQDYWARLEQDVRPFVDDQKPSKLTALQQHQLLQHVLEKGIDDWKEIAERLGLSDGQEAVTEFLRARNTPALLGKEATENLKVQSFKYLMDHARSISQEGVKPLTKVAPYSQVDQLFFQCGLLKTFASQQDHAVETQSLEERRKKKLKTKLAYRCIIQEFATMKEDLQHLTTLENAHSKAKNDLRNLRAQLFSEKVSMRMLDQQRR